MNSKLNIVERDVNKNPRQIRQAGFIPVSLYGKNIEPKNLQVNAHEFEMASRNASEEWELNLGKEKFNA
ncbi:hypothetical protein IJ670_00960, partial [bacterium]|nr:hypothetical protein [bacterium]